MMRDDYEKFAQIAPKALHKNYFYQNWKTEPEYPYNFAKVRMNHTVFDEKGLSHLNIHKGIYVDIFAIDKMSEDKKTRLREHKKSLRLQAAQELLYVDLHKKRNVFKSLFLRMYRALLSRKYMHKKLDRLLKRHNATESRLCGDRLWNNILEYHTDDYERQIYVEFEGKKRPIPSGYDHILRTEFGDYMKFPPEEERYPHHNYFYLDFGDFFD